MTEGKPSDESVIWITGPYSRDGTGIQIRRAVVHERLGSLTETTVEFLWKTRDEALGTFLGETMTIHVAGEGESGPDRRFTGTIVSVETLGVRRGMAHFVAELRPRLWMLTRRRNSRVFQEMTTEDIIKSILEEHGIARYEFKLNDTHKARPTCVQYRETDFDFVSRLMEQDGIYYYFDHADSSHETNEKVVFCDGSGSHGPVPGNSTLPYIARDQSEAQRGDHIAEWARLQELQSTKVSLTDWNFLTPRGELQKSEIEMGSGTLVPKGEVHDHPGQFAFTGREFGSSADVEAIGKHRAKVWMESLAARFDLRRGAGTVRSLASGFRFSVKPEEDEDASIDETECMVVDAVYYLQEEGGFEEVDIRRDLVSERVEIPEGNKDIFSIIFTAMDATDNFRSPLLTPWPKITGPQTATVVGPSGKEIHSDALGRIRVRFHWMRKEDGSLGSGSALDDQSSCWMRVVTPWAGSGWGFAAIPRVGMEAVVEFEDGHPDMPICTGMVYNKELKPPYDYADEKNWTKQGIRSNKSPGGGGFNELTFDDTSGSEHVYFQSEKDYEEFVRNDASVKIDNNLDHVVKADETREVTQGNLSINVKAGKATIEAAQKIELICGGSKITMTPQKIEMEAMAVDIRGTMSAKMNGNTSAEITSPTLVKVQGAFVKIN